MTIHAPQPGDDWLPQVVELLDRQRSLFRELDELSRQQSRLVEAGQAEPLLVVLAQKQRVIEDVEDVNRGLSVFTSDWGARVAALPERSRVLLRTRTDELETLAKAVHARDEHDRSALEAQSRVVSNELATMARTRGAAAAYGAMGGNAGGGMGGSTGPRFQDRRG